MKASDEGHISALMLARALSCAALRYSLSERDESGGRRRPDTWSTVSSRLVGNGEFPKVVSDHLRLDLNLVERVSVVDADDGTNHLWNDDHVSEVRSHGLWLLSLWGFLLGLVELLNQSVSLALQTTLELSPRSGAEELNKLVLVHIKKLFEVNTSERELPESSSLSWLSVSHLCSICVKV